MHRTINTVILCLVLCLVQLTGLLQGNYENLAAGHGDLESMWELFKSENSKSYDNLAEEATRYQIWRENYLFILKHNKEAAENFSVGVNNFCDLTQQEISRVKHGLNVGLLSSRHSSHGHHVQKARVSESFLEDLIQNTFDVSNNFTPKLGKKFSESMDWSSRGFVSPVKDQGLCGACWSQFNLKSFVTTGILESYYRIINSVQNTFSEQNLMDCSSSYGNAGCDGGLMSFAFHYIIDNKGLNSDRNYAYQGATTGKCKYVSSDPAAQAVSYVSLPVDENALKAAVATIGPVAVGIDANHKSFSLYKSGIYFEPDCSPDNLNHAVMVVGYGTENGKDYWLIKNSWGTKWGMDGFGKMARNRNNHCGIASLAGFPIIPKTTKN